MMSNLIRSYATVSTKFSQQFSRQTLYQWMKRYEDFVGLTEVKLAQSRVLEAETKFMKSQENRREAQRQIGAIQQKLHDLRAELDRIPRGEDKYLTLITQEHAVMKDEKRLREEFQLFEKEERDNFSALSHAVRDSHEKERAQAEKTKYWSIIGSVMGTMIGIVGTTINNRLRMKELRELVEQSANSNKSFIEFDKLIEKVTNNIQEQSLNSKALGEHLEERFNFFLTKSAFQIAEEVCQRNEAILQQNERLQALLLGQSGLDGDKINVCVLSQNQLCLLLEDKKNDLMKAIVVATIFIPVCTWILCKFVNM